MKLAMITALIAALAAAPPPAAVGDLAWLAGRWVAVDGERWTEEYWATPRGGAMIGFSRTGRGDVLRQFEFIRIAPGEHGVPVYLASPGGGPAIAFQLVAHDAASATFANSAHDYPQRIHYRRIGDTLTATVSAADGSDARRWSYRLAR